MEIAAKLADALSMFWQSLDEQERRLLALGVAYLGVMIVLGVHERRQKERELDELAAQVTARLVEAARGSHHG